MSTYCYPFINQATTDTQYTTLARNWCFTGITGEAGNSALQVFAQADGMQVYVRPTTTNNTAVINGFCFVSTTIEAVPIGIADNTYARIDTVVVRVHQADDGTETRGELAVVKGIPSASPVPPPLLQTMTDLYEFPLADVLVPAGAVTIFPQNVTPDRRIFARKQEVNALLGNNFGNYAGILPQEKVGNLPASKITSGTLPIARGGTGATDTAGARSNLGTSNATNITSGTLGVDRIPGLPASKITSGTLDINTRTSGTLSIARGGTGATNEANARSNLRIYSDVVTITAGSPAINYAWGAFNLPSGQRAGDYIFTATVKAAGTQAGKPNNICNVMPHAEDSTFVISMSKLDSSNYDPGSSYQVFVTAIEKNINM